MGAVNAVILCPGDSLSPALTALHDGGIDPSFTIGVNRAVEAYPCDYWCAMDANPYRDTKPKGRPKYVIRWDQLRKLGDDAPDLEQARVIKKQMDGYPRRVDYSSYSMLAAIAFAAEQGAARIDIYGSDWDGTGDWDGWEHPQPHRRNEKRWGKERRLFNELKDYYEGEGITVSRKWIEREPITFIWYGPKMPNWGVRNINQFAKLNPDRRIYLHGEEVLLDKYRKYAAQIEPGYKSGLGNLLRYSALQRYGGWYFDVDFWPLRPLKEAEKMFDLNDDKLFCGYQRKKGDIKIANGFLHASKNSPAWADVDAAMDSLKPPYKWLSLGPKLLTKAAEQSENLHVIGREWFYPLRSNVATEQYNKIVGGESTEYLKNYNAETDGEMPFAMHLWANNFGGGLI